MRISLAEPKYLRDSISIISDLVNDAKFKITKESIELVAMDPANVAMVIFKMFSSAFTEYNIEKDVEISLNLGNLKQILKRANANDMLTLELKDNRLKVEMKGATSKTFSLPIIELEDKELKVPELQFPITIEMPCTMLDEGIADADIVAESVSLIADPDKFTISAEGDLNKVDVGIEGENVKITSPDGEKVKAKYSIEYLKKMITASKLADNVVIKFNKDYPLLLEYKAIDRVMLSFILAPRVEND